VCMVQQRLRCVQCATCCSAVGVVFDVVALHKPAYGANHICTCELAGTPYHAVAVWAVKPRFVQSWRSAWHMRLRLALRSAPMLCSPLQAQLCQWLACGAWLTLVAPECLVLWWPLLRILCISVCVEWCQLWCVQCAVLSMCRPIQVLKVT
jgi:hypothetical protein